MFIGCPSSKFAYPLEALGGVRIISSYIPTSTTAGSGVERISNRESGYSFVSIELPPARSDSFASLY
jgi:hypothetical protein